MRSRPTALLLLCLISAFLWLTPSSATTAKLRVNESATRVWPRANKTEVALAVENLTGRPLRAKIELEWVDPADLVDGKTERRETIAPGASKLTVPFLLPKEIHEQDKTLWYRLRYRVAPESGNTFLPVSGIISLSEITPDLFELRVTASEYPIPGKTYRAHIRALHPLNNRPVGGVNVTANLKFDNDRQDSFKATGLTNAQGYVALDFALPRNLVAEDGEVEINATRGEFTQKAEFETRNDPRGMNRIILTTDKPIYQPGQTLHLRALLFDFINRALPNANLELEISDPEGTRQFRADLKTSRFGVANVDWQIPDNTRLGEYRISLEMDDDKHGEAQMETRVKISRYDLPNFAVKTKSDREFYLPGQNAEVTISAEYLFGQPVTKGKVRIVREGEERWDSAQKKYVREEAETFEGELDTSGRFVAKIDLTEAHDDFSNEEYDRFEDRTYAAYLTDATTGRTEQKRFDLRVTRDPIHVYVIGLEYRASENLPLQFYVSTSYADGKPAECEVTINELIETDDDDEPIERQLRKIKTNARGLAKISGLSLPKREDRNDRLELSLTAHDGKNRAGHRKENLRLRDDLTLRVETDKAIYRPNEPIEVQIKASAENALAILSITRDLEVVHSQAVKLRGGKAFVVIPYRPAFSGEVGVAVTVEGADEDGEYRSAQDSRAVIYPRDRELKLDVRMSSAEYRPGDDGRASFRVTTAEGRPLESVLGVTVVDSAVEERARTDSEFNGRRYYNFSGYYLDTGSGLAGVTVRDLRKLDTTQPISAELQLIAEILLLESGYQPRIETSAEYARDPKQVFKLLIGRQFMPVSNALEKHFQKTGEYPTSRARLHEILNLAEVNFEAMRDPWGIAYRVEFTTEREFDYFHAISAGADKKFDTADDFRAFTNYWPYFTKTGEQIRLAMKQFNERDGRVTLDAAEFKEALKRSGLDFDALRDRWGKPYLLSLSIAGNRWFASVHSSGADGKFAPTVGSYSDDFVVWVSGWAYFERTASRLDELLAKHLKTTGEYPSNETELRSILKANGIEFDSLRDPWGNGFYATFTNTFRYGDRVVVRYDDLQQKKTELQPMTQRINIILIRSRGADGKQNTNDDFAIAEFSQLTAQMSSYDQQPKNVDNALMMSGLLGEIRGIVTDAQGAVIANTTVKLTRTQTQLERNTTSDSSGSYQFRNLPPGTYQMECHAPGFKKLVITDIRVLPTTVTNVTLTLEVGSVSEAVMVTGVAAQFQTENASMSQTVTSKQIANLPLNARNVANLLALSPGTQGGKSELATPRLREHFQETLVWQPQLETDKQGRATLKFKMADNITTWKLTAVASTMDGQIGIAETEFRAFQPFFAEHDPPKVLTEGDEISLPVMLRNYLDKSLSVTTEMKPETWFTLLGAARQQTRVAARDSTNAVFDFRVTASTAKGKQRVTALSTTASDAIEKPVSVHPDGEELAQTIGSVFDNNSKLNITIPADVIKSSVRAELKIYPNLMTHALEGIEGILHRPYGCGEQTISSTYPNVLALRYLRQQDESVAGLAAKARRYVQAGYERLLGYRADSGGFSYWGRGEADLALTAYAVRFLNDAREFVAVDDDVVTKARDWLVARQQPDGSWEPYLYGNEDQRRSALTTAYIARVLAAETKRSTKPDKKLSESLQRALKFVAVRADEIDEPYLIASFALAAFDAGETESATKASARLRQLSRDEAGTSYWNLESNTPFYGWGLAGRVETTALAVKALKKDAETRKLVDTARDELIDQGLLFLIRNKDRYGVWYSTQATINVLDTMVSLYEAEKIKTSAGGQAEVLVNGNRIGSFVAPSSDKLGNPLTLDVSSALSVGDNRIEIRRSGDVTLATAQLVETHYAAWKTNASEAREEAKGKSSALRLAVGYDKPQAKIGEEITCTVKAERIGYSGYGMMLGEIGLPPGADVDRASLELAMKTSGWELNQYDVLPDRIVVYLWPRAGGTKFSFKFKLRYGIRAQSAPSVLYDYYNPEARVVIAPTRFIAK